MAFSQRKHLSLRTFAIKERAVAVVVIDHGVERASFRSVLIDAAVVASVKYATALRVFQLQPSIELLDKIGAVVSQSCDLFYILIGK